MRVPYRYREKKTQYKKYCIYMKSKLIPHSKNIADEGCQQLKIEMN